MLETENLTKDKGTILIAEDELITSMELENLVKNWGFNSIRVTSGEESLKLALKEKPNIILMEVRLMGPMDGIQASQRISEKLDVPIIFITAYTDEKTTNKAKESLPFAFLSKPINHSELKFTIELALIKHDMERKLRESEKKYRYLADNVKDIISIFYTDDGSTKYLSPSVKNVLGYEISELTDNNFFKYVHPEDLSKLSRFVNLEDDPIFQAEYRVLKKDNTYIWVETSGELVLNGKNGRREIIALTRDISKRKQLEMNLNKTIKEKNNLMGEINHRTKNNLMIISSLINLQSLTIKEEKTSQALLDIGNRVNTIAMIHENLYNSLDVSEVNIKTYINSILNNLSHTYNINYKNINLISYIDDMYVNIETATPCGLIINELFSNSIKYAFTSDDDDKKIFVSFKNLDYGNLCLKISDNGVGLPENFNFDDSKSLGLRLVENLVIQLGGKMEIKNDDGVEFEVIFKELLYDKRV